jgi:hypothetical protein
MQALRVNFEPDVADGRPRSRAAAAREAALFAKELRAWPEDFEEIIREQCCSDLIQWADGRGPVGVTPVLERLRFGEIASAPVLSDTAYLVPKRLDPAKLPKPLPPMYELPAPAHPDLDKIVQNTDPAALADGVRRLRAHVKHIDVGTKQAALAQSLESLAASFEAVPNLEARKLDTWRTALAGIRGLLGAENFEKFQATVNAWVSQQVTDGRP